EVALRDLAHALAERLSGAQAGDYGERSGFALAVVATSPADLLSKLRKAREAIEAGAWSIQEPSGVGVLGRPRWECGKVAFLFPGQGSQYPGMLADLAIAVPGVFQAFEEVDRALARRGRPVVGPIVFPPPAWDEETTERQRRQLATPEVAQPA